MLLIDELHNATIVEPERSRIDVLSVGVVPYHKYFRLIRIVDV